MAWGDAPYGALPPAGTVYAYATPEGELGGVLLGTRAAFAHPRAELGSVMFSIPFATPTVVVVNNELLEVTSAITIDSATITTTDPWSPAFVTSIDGADFHTTPLTPGGSYVLVLVILGSEVLIPFTVPVGVEDPEGSIVAQKEPRVWGVLEALSWAISKELQFIGGRPSSRTTHDLAIGDTILRVNSTLGYPDRGFLFIEGLLLEYTSKADTAFQLVEDFRARVIPQGTLVVSKTNSIPPRNLV